MTRAMAEMPKALAELAAELRVMDRNERSETLIDFADRFEEVSEAISRRPFAEIHRAPRCESDAYVFATDSPDGTLRFHFAVENPQGISARAWGRILDETASGAPLEEVLAISPEVLYDLFGRDLSMGKGQGLIGMLELVQFEVKQRVRARG
ncbi:MAG: hypothetical protein HOP12_10400 [Candidatus Eisenbacteria bacterium]|uniref:Fe-S metabolism associated domain-containing protein n=1 Tax=Eiseniibacteriota bacterium TaxID=2212470 RepID=A0A849SFP7_UNCEI|nr:hypothetical protein [Candidatus Eisenbacteria bacterium]